ncbi:MAG: tRNA uridine-5-carboxymethylaminomethyl(34) synthesis GTPase MnmE [Bacteroidetes bacterium]|nr:tRNA uridine-5-carboxymethylaminomethyl(34) synthesis GTPase MnmE [Bacteroidota bacterium]
MNRAYPQGSVQDTIVAIATPPGSSGIAVIRVSGGDAIDQVAGLFRGRDLRSVASHTLHHGSLVDAKGDTIDDVLVAVFRAPQSYTGEHSIEISCHGGSIVSRRVLARLLETGIRHAEPGEFTRRAFLNGKMDLVQAEAVADLIHAQSEEAYQASVRQLEGRLSRFVTGIRDALLDAASMLELSLDFAEDDVEFLDVAQLRILFERSLVQLREALASYDSGRLLRDGVRVVLAGPPNVGKSSLLNALLGMQRAIVTDVPGTTRDYIEESMLLHGEYLRFIDTAGLREASDRIEEEGIALGREILQNADIVCLLVDAREGHQAGVAVRDLALLEDHDTRVLLVFNKTDLVPEDQVEYLSAYGIPLSVLTGQGMTELTQRLAALARSTGGSTEQGSVLVTNARHADCLQRGIAALEDAQRAHEEGMTEEILAGEVRRATQALGEIIGAVSSEDVLNSIFSRFCIGK